MVENAVCTSELGRMFCSDDGACVRFGSDFGAQKRELRPEVRPGGGVSGTLIIIGGKEGQSAPPGETSWSAGGSQVSATLPPLLSLPDGPSSPFVRQVAANRAPLLGMPSWHAGYLPASHDFSPRLLSVGTCPNGATCKANTAKKRLFLTERPAPTAHTRRARSRKPSCFYLVNPIAAGQRPFASQLYCNVGVKPWSVRVPLQRVHALHSHF
jgi:hypothetical protein